MPFNILVINPYITDFKLYDEWMHPAGLYFLMDILEAHGHNISYFNCLKHTEPPSRKYGTGNFNFLEIEKPELYSGIKRKYKLYGRAVSELRQFLETTPKPDYVCIGSMMTYWGAGVLETIRLIREVYPTVTVIIGGIAAQLMPHYFKRHVDNCKVGDLIHPEISALLGIQKFPVPSFLKGFKVLTAPITHSPVILTLGCPMNCTYCASSVLQPFFQYRPVDLVIKEVDYMINHFGVIDFAFYDDALLYKPETVLIPFLKMIRDRNYNIRFHTPNGLHLRYITEPLLELMLNTGFTTLRFGYESGDRRYLQDTSGKINQNELVNKLGIVKRYCSTKQDIGIYIMGGLKWQTPDQMLTEMDFIGSLGVKVKPVFISPVPRTTLYQFYLADFPSLKEDPLWHNDSFFITQLPGWDIEAVEAVREKAKSINSDLGNRAKSPENSFEIKNKVETN